MANKNTPITYATDETRYMEQYSATISNPETARKLALISATDAVTAYAGLRLAYFMASITDVEAKKEVKDGVPFKSAVDMIEKTCNLKKSMISNYRIVGAMVTDDKGSFNIPDHFKGFTVTQLLEARQKLGTTEKVEEAVKGGEIDCTMSAKTIRENLTTQEEATAVAEKKASDKRNHDRKTALQFGEKNGIPIIAYNASGEKEIIGYAVASVAYELFVEAVKGGFAALEGKDTTYAIREQ